jgi:hypothetical protein
MTKIKISALEKNEARERDLEYYIRIMQNPIPFKHVEGVKNAKIELEALKIKIAKQYKAIGKKTIGFDLEKYKRITQPDLYFDIKEYVKKYYPKKEEEK